MRCNGPRRAPDARTPITTSVGVLSGCLALRTVGLRIALVSRDEVYPLHGGGIGQFVTTAATLLSRVAEVTIFATSLLQERYERFRAVGDERLPGEDVRVVFVPEPSVQEAGGWYHLMHCYSARVLECLREVYGDRGPELIEFADYLGEGFVTLQAAWALDRFLARTRVCVRVHTTAEIGEVLNGYWKPDLPSRVVHELERFSLARADRLIWQGGDVLGTYRRFYGASGIAPAVRIRHPHAGLSGDVSVDGGFVLRGPLRLLYAGRLERRKGVVNLVRAVTGLGRDDVRLTLVGGDTETGPLGTSMRGQLELAIAGDERVRLLDGVDRSQLAGLIADSDVVAVPSLWECWPYAALEPLRLNRPVLGTPVGGLVELVRRGRSGWLASGTDAVALGDALERLLDARGEVQELVRGGAPVAYARGLCDEREILEGYERLAGAELARPVARRRVCGSLPLVSVVVPYYRMSGFVREAIESVSAQRYRRLEIVLVNDGSFEDEDCYAPEIAGRVPVVVVTQMNQGPGAAWNFGVSQSRGRYVFALDAGNVAEPEFVARCVEILERRPEVAYVTSWSRYVGEDRTPRPGAGLGYEPLGNQAALITEENVGGDAAAVIRRRIFDLGFGYSEELTSFEDWHFYRELRAAGRFGAVIPERLLRCRVREDSMQAQIAQPHRGRLLGEIQARIQENAMQWTSSSA